MGQRKSLTLAAWIDQVGVPKIAQHFCLERSTVRKWRDGSQIPKTLHLWSIHKLSDGQVSYEAMIEPWAKRQGLKKP